MKPFELSLALINIAVGGAVAISTNNPLWGLVNYATAALICADAICDSIRGRT